MSEIVDVLSAIERLQSEGQRMALATIVAVRGSTYRRPGARLLVPETGAPIGNISGGCLENDVADMARRRHGGGQARMAVRPHRRRRGGVGARARAATAPSRCSSSPPRTPPRPRAPCGWRSRSNSPIAMITVLDSERSRRRVRARGSWSGRTADRELARPSRWSMPAAMAAANELLDAERSEVRILATEDGEVRVFVEVLEPPLRLVILGAGHDAIPLVAVAATIGWQPIVVDDRPAVPQSRAVPRGSRFIALERPDEVAAKAPIDTADVRGRDDAQLPSGQGLPPVAADDRRAVPRDARTGRADQAAADELQRRASCRRGRPARGSTAPPGSTSAARGPRRSRRSSPRSWRSSAAGRRLPEAAPRPEITTVRSRAPKPGSQALRRSSQSTM